MVQLEMVKWALDKYKPEPLYPEYPVCPPVILNPSITVTGGPAEMSTQLKTLSVCSESMTGYVPYDKFLNDTPSLISSGKVSG